MEVANSMYQEEVFLIHINSLNCSISEPIFYVARSLYDANLVAFTVLEELIEDEIKDVANCSLNLKDLIQISLERELYEVDITPLKFARIDNSEVSYD